MLCQFLPGPASSQLGFSIGLLRAGWAGALGAALYNPVFTSAVRGPVDLAIALTGFMLLAVWRASPLLVVIWCVGASVARSLLL